MNWYQKRFIVERECTCSKANGGKSGECRSIGWHAVDGFDNAGAAIGDALACARKQWGKYRVVELSTGNVVGQPIDFRPVVQ